MQMPFGGAPIAGPPGAPAVRAPAALPSKSELLGTNPKDGGSRWNTDMPGGVDEAKSFFQRLTAGQSLTKKEDKYGNSRTTTSDQQYNLRINGSNGDVRIDRPIDIGGKDRETIHFNKR